jgi:Rieske Fe-S protein
MEDRQALDPQKLSLESPAINRRSFFGVLLGIGTAGMGALLAIPVLRYAFYPLYAKASQSGWSDAGSTEGFANLVAPALKTIEFKQRDGWREVVSSQSVYVTKGKDGQLKVLSAICPHLGCSISWQHAQGEFVCPCHGGRFASPHKVDDGKLLVHFEYFRSNVPNQEKLS